MSNSKRYFYRLMRTPYVVECKCCKKKVECHYMVFPMITSAGYPYCRDCTIEGLGLKQVLSEVTQVGMTYIEELKKEFEMERDPKMFMSVPPLEPHSRCIKCTRELEGRIEREMAMKHDGLCGVCYRG